MPVDDRTGVVATIFAPPHPRPAPTTPRATGPAAVEDRAAMLRDDDAGDDVTGLARRLLLGDQDGGPRTAAGLLPIDASYDFDEYVLLRGQEDAAGLSPSSAPDYETVVPGDRAFSQLLGAVRSGITEFLDQVLVSAGLQPTPQQAVLVSGLASSVHGNWRFHCSVRAYNRLGRYSRTSINEYYGAPISPERFYADSLRWYLVNNADDEALGYILGGGHFTLLSNLLSTEFWERALEEVFAYYFLNIELTDPAAPTEYPFDLFPVDEVVFGLRVVHRQTWRLLGHARGDLVRTVPLGPRESRKASVKVTRRSKITTTDEQVTSVETSAESAATTKATSEIVDEASKKLNKHAEAEAGGGFLGFFQAKISGGIAEDTANSSRQTKSRLNETMAKTASRLKRETRVTVSTESESTFDETSAAELTNPNDEIAVTYLYHRLQEQFWISTEIGEVDSVVFVPETVPDWDDITETWVRDRGDVIAAALLDPSYANVLDAIRNEPSGLAYGPAHHFDDAATAGIAAATGYQDFTGGGAMPDLLASGQMYFERDFERRSNQRFDNLRRAHQTDGLLLHIRRNILHYMRALWNAEDYDQRMQRYSRIRVPTDWVFVPWVATGGPGPGPLEAEGVFQPIAASARPLSEIIDPVGPIGYLFNCVIFRLRDDPRLANTHQALAYLRATYTDFRVVATPGDGAGVSLRQATAFAPLRFVDDFTIEYRAARAMWLQPRPGLPENEWFELHPRADGAIDVRGIRLWMDGDPADAATITIALRSTTGMLDPHLRLVRLSNPLPAAADEPAFFTNDVLRDIVAVLPELVPAGVLDWATLTSAEQAAFRAAYHRYRMLRETGRAATVDTGNLVLDLEGSRTVALEPFKRLHRFVDVVKEVEEYERRRLDNVRRSSLLDAGRLADPDIERVTVVGSLDPSGDVVVVPDGIIDDPDEPLGGRNDR